MTDQFDEKISSLVDGELSESEHQQTVTSMLADKDKCRCWERYHLISNAIKRDLPNMIDCQFASRVMAEIENEPTILAPPSHRTSTFGKRMAGLAVAASVATVAILGVQVMHQDEGTISVQQMATVSGSDLQSAKVPVPQVYNRQDVQTVTQSFHQSPIPDQISRQMLPRIHQYLLDHAQVAPGAMSQNVTPFSRLKADPNSENLAQQKESQTQDQNQR